MSTIDDPKPGEQDPNADPVVPPPSEPVDPNEPREPDTNGDDDSPDRSDDQPQ